MSAAPKDGSKKLVIDRSRWLRGEGHGESYLVRSCDGKMCCLGFYALACGDDPEVLRNERSPAEVWDKTRIPGWLIDGAGNNTEIADALMKINDSETMPAVEREGKIWEIFANHGVSVEFVDG